MSAIVAIQEQLERLELLLVALESSCPPTFAAEYVAQISHALLNVAESLRHEAEEEVA